MCCPVPELTIVRYNSNEYKYNNAVGQAINTYLINYFIVIIVIITIIKYYYYYYYYGYM